MDGATKSLSQKRPDGYDGDDDDDWGDMEGEYNGTVCVYGRVEASCKLTFNVYVDSEWC